MSKFTTPDEHCASRIHECSEPRGGATIIEVSKRISKLTLVNVWHLIYQMISLTSGQINLIGQRFYHSIWRSRSRANSFQWCHNIYSRYWQVDEGRTERYSMNFSIVVDCETLFLDRFQRRFKLNIIGRGFFMLKEDSFLKYFHQHKFPSWAVFLVLDHSCLCKVSYYHEIRLNILYYSPSHFVFHLITQSSFSIV